MAVVVLPLPLEQLKTKAEWESSARALFMASRSLSKSWNQDHNLIKSMQVLLSLPPSPFLILLHEVNPEIKLEILVSQFIER